MKIELQLLVILKGFFITIFQEKAENKNMIWESKTTFIYDFNDKKTDKPIQY